jgi:hypothetical protein
MDDALPDARHGVAESDEPWMVMGRHFCWDRDGTPISLEAFERLRYETPGYFRVALDRVGDAQVSTVWTGLALPLFAEDCDRPLIFETMIFGGPYSDYLWRYVTEVEALTGHFAVVKGLRERIETIGSLGETRAKRG